ncbi:hypothetical protein LWI28_008825 [Acer negundo]|uniref:Hydrophobic seed protein domain-containing protein n=1 Tax=Acer negundo TaxID=4023 RepID=A0AAD5IVE7_ACENE|nr:hypothetical protein LWI28_008825 [Acer negundo]
MDIASEILPKYRSCSWRFATTVKKNTNTSNFTTTVNIDRKSIGGGGGGGGSPGEEKGGGSPGGGGNSPREGGSSPRGGGTSLGGGGSSLGGGVTSPGGGGLHGGGGSSPRGGGCPPRTTPPPHPSYSIDVMKLGLCVDVLGGLVHIGFGDPVENVCCPVIQGMIEMEAAVCLCIAIRIKFLNMNIFIPMAFQALLTCGKTPPGFICPPL